MLQSLLDSPWVTYLHIVLSGLDLNYNTLLFGFLLAFFLLIYLLLRTPRQRRNWILIGNLVFYLWSGIGAFLIVVFTALVAYGTTRRIEAIYAGFDGTGMKAKERRVAFAAYEKRARRWVAAAIVFILAIWAAVKIGKLIGLSSVGISGLLSGKGIIVPLGISYYTLCIVAYIMDVYWQKTSAEHNILKLFTAMTYFPYIVQGPFCRYQKIMTAFDQLPKPDYTRVTQGLQLMIWGYFKKLVIADRLLILTDTIFGTPAGYAGVEILLAVLFGAVQLYADFSGCMDIVRGVSQILGIELPFNFRQPFFAKSAAEFWRRWHITLGEWTKEYIYLPIAMNGKFLKKGRTIKKNHGALAAKTFSSFFPLFAVWLFTGLWHGTGWDYICWGMYWGLIIIIAQITEDFWQKLCKKMHIDPESTWLQVWRMIRTFLIFCIGRMWTVTGLTNGFFVLWKQLFTEGRLWIFTDGTLFTYGLDQQDFLIAVISIVILFAVDVAHERGVAIRERLCVSPIVLRWIVCYAAIFAVVIFGIYGPGYDASSFVYGNF